MGNEDALGTFTLCGSRHFLVNSTILETSWSANCINLPRTSTD